MEGGSLPIELTSSFLRKKSVRVVAGGRRKHRYREAKAPVEGGGKMNGQGGREKCWREWAYEKEEVCENGSQEGHSELLQGKSR